MKIITRKEWGAKPINAYNGNVSAGARIGVVIHHSVTGEGTTQESVSSILRGIDDFHRRKGWGGIGYNFAVDHRGRIYEARGMDVVGVHASGSNTGHYGICFIGNSDKHITAAAVNAIQELVNYLQIHSKKKLRVVGHRDVNQTGCPGSKLYTRIKNGRFEIPYVKMEYMKAREGDSYRKIGARYLGIKPTPANLPQRITEARRIKALNNNATIVAGMRVRVK
jgi:hypothetical protein